ncbi:Gfo/Idh/MocA family protein [Paenibacillus sp. CF384]|uniref:Gfo/Idh/MocA family protein n=1 Tax=Paenibacillus sp. CF384 TaxID=1884382 RepID=UPI000894A19D|nr:Gfo/Idh/MocA family oxidoreductase [Paenibacillus sp. CF384]SDW41643.1 Predicted dehydrogenase [Paenibacillus sp. CF384]
MEGHGRFTPIGRQYGIGIVGLGEGKGLVKGLAGHPELKVVAVCDANEQLAETIARQYAVPHFYSSLEAMLAREDIDFVAIYTPDQMHFTHIRQSFEAGKHVLCTKPLVNSMEEAREVLAYVRANPERQLMVGQSSRFFGPMQHQREAYEAGKLGTLSFAETQYVHDMRWFYNERAWAREGGFDLLFACCSHPVDLIRWYMGDVEEVSAYSSQSDIAIASGFDGHDTFVINLKFRSGKIGRVLGLYGLEHLHQTRPWIEVALYGTKGTFIGKYPQLEAQIKYEGEKERTEHYFEDIYHYFQFEGVNHHAGEFVNYTEHFARNLHQGTRAMPDAEDGFQTIATLEAIRQSIRTGSPVRVEGRS